MTIGLDINENSIKLVELKETAPPVFAARKHQGAIAEALRKIWAELKIQEKNVYISLSGLSVYTRRVLLPAIPESEIKEAIGWEVKNFIPFSVKEAIIKYSFLGKSKDKLDYIAVALEAEKLKQKIGQIEEAGLKAAGATTPPFALIRTLKKTEEAICLIDIGAQTTGINIYKNNLLQFTRDINIAGENFTKAIAEGLNLPFEQAENVKVKYGIPKPDESIAELADNGAKLKEAAGQVFKRFLNEIFRSFDYFKEKFYEVKIDRIALSGGSAQLKGLAENLARELGLPVEILELPPGLAPGFACALGLAMGKTAEMNLLETAETKAAPKLEAAIKVSPRLLILILAFIVSLGIIYNFYLGARHNYYKKHLAERQITVSQIKILSASKAISQQIIREEGNLREILIKFSSLIPSGAVLNELTYNNADKKITVQGSAKNANLIGELLKAIEDSRYFKETKLEEIKKIEGGETFKLKLTAEK